MARPINPTAPTLRPTNTTATTNTTAAAATTAATNVDNAADATPVDAMEAPRETGTTAGVPKVQVNGLKNLQTKFDDFAVTRGSGTFNVGSSSAGAVDRGFIKCDANPIAGGCRLTVESFHSQPDDKLTLVLMAEVLDTKSNELKTINLAVLGNQLNLNGDGFRGKAEFDISYADVNKYLKKFNDKLQLSPGKTNLSVMAFFNDDNGTVQHRAGGPARGGRFRLPEAPGTMSPIATRIGGAVGTDADLPVPLDMQVAYPAKLADAYPMLKGDGNIVSRLESEFKGSTDKDAMIGAIHSMYALVKQAEAGDHKSVEDVLGKDWTVSTVNRYWVKDDGSSDAGAPGTGQFKGFRVDEEGLPLQDPMRDTYMDNPRLGMTAHEGAIRVRTNKQATQINVKPGGGRLDSETGIKQRIEVGLELTPDAGVAEAAEFLRGVSSSSAWTDSVFNHAEKQVKKLESKLKLAETLEPWLDVVQDRHKFTVKNEKTGVEIEFSFDIVTATTVRPEHADQNGEPRTAKFYVLEGELDHLQLGSTNQGTFAAADADGGSFKTDDAQEDWLKGTSEAVTLDIDPRLHELEDLENDKFRQTPSYRAFESVNDRLKKAIFPKGFSAAKQKAAHAADVLGLVPLTKEAVTGKVRHAVVDAGLKWTPELKSALDNLVQTQGHIEKVDDLYYSPGRQTDVVTTLERIYGIQLPPLEYDQVALVDKVSDKLGEIGLKTTPEVEAFLGKLDIATMSPRELNSELSRMSGLEDDEIFLKIAAKHGIAVPKAAPDLDKLSSMLEEQFDAAWIDKAHLGQVTELMGKALKGGKSAKQMRDMMNDLIWNSNNQLKVLEVDGQKPPLLTVDPQKFADSVVKHMKDADILVDDAMRDFFVKVAPHAGAANEAKSAVTTYRTQSSLDAIAKKAEIEAPVLKYDLAALEPKWERAAEQSGLRFTSALKKFCAQMLEANNAPSSINSFISQFSRGDAANAASRLTMPEGAKVPERTWLMSAVDSQLKTAAEGEFFFYNDDAQALARAILKNPKVGLDALKSAFGRVADRGSFAEAFKSSRLEIPEGLTLPDVNWNEKAILKHVKDQSGGSYNDEVEKYLKKNLPLALKKDDFVLGDTRWVRLNSFLLQIKRATGNEPPAVG